jgi:hypothetical protein
MSRLALSLVLAVLAPGCCFGGGAGAIDSGPAAPVIPLGNGVLPTPPPLFAGVEAPYPVVGAPEGTEGYIVRSGSATAQVVSGLPGVSQGTQCSYTQYRTSDPTINCRWNVTCGGYVLYGLARAGYQTCTNATWPAGTLMFDPQTSSRDGDPMFIFNSTGISIGDDGSGRIGTFSATLTVP